MVYLGNIPADTVNFHGVEIDEGYYRGFKVWPSSQNIQRLKLIVDYNVQFDQARESIFKDVYYDELAYETRVRFFENITYNNTVYRRNELEDGPDNTKVLTLNRSRSEKVVYDVNTVPSNNGNIKLRQYPLDSIYIYKVNGVEVGNGFNQIYLNRILGSNQNLSGVYFKLPQSVFYIEGLDKNSSYNINLTILATTPPTVTASNIGDNFLGVPNSFSGNIYVPAQSVEAYKVAKGWKEYASHIQAITE